MDDFAVIGHDKAHLHQARRDIEDFLHARLGLRCTHKPQIFPVAPGNGRALDFRFLQRHSA